MQTVRSIFYNLIEINIHQKYLDLISSTLPAKLKDPFNQNIALFNDVLDLLSKFPVKKLFQ